MKNDYFLINDLLWTDLTSLFVEGNGAYSEKGGSSFPHLIRSLVLFIGNHNPRKVTLHQPDVCIPELAFPPEYFCF